MLSLLGLNGFRTANYDFNFFGNAQNFIVEIAVEFCHP